MGATAAISMVALGTASRANAYSRLGGARRDLANYNANVAEVMAADALARGREAEIRHRQGTRKLIGSQRAAFAASGVDISDADSTAVNVFADTAALSEIDALTIRSNAAREAWGHRAKAREFAAQGQIYEYEGDQRAIGEVLGSAGSVMGARYGFR